MDKMGSGKGKRWKLSVHEADFNCMNLIKFVPTIYEYFQCSKVQMLIRDNLIIIVDGFYSLEKKTNHT